MGKLVLLLLKRRPAFIHQGKKKTVSANSCQRFILLLGFALLWAMTDSAAAFKGAERYAKVSFLEGPVLIKDRSSDIRDATLDGIIKTGESVQTRDQGKAGLTLSDGSILRLGPNTELLIKLKRTPQKNLPYRIQAILGKGRLWVNRAAGKQNLEKWETVTRDCLVISSQGVFRIDYFPDGAQLIKFYKGDGVIRGPVSFLSIKEANQGDDAAFAETSVSVPPWQFRLKAYEQIIINSMGRATKPFRFAAKADQTPWVRWNQALDKLVVNDSSP